MKTKFFTKFITLIIFLTIFIVFFKGLKNSSIYVPDYKTKKDIPFFNTKIFNTNKKINSKEFFENDRYYLMNIWASWCFPCREEHVYLMDLSNEKNLYLIGLNYKDTEKNAKNFLVKFNNPYDIIFEDKNGTIAIEWGAYGVPETFLIRDNKVIKKVIGPLNENLLDEIKELIK